MAEATMQDLIKEVKLVSDRETRATQDVFNAVGKLNQNVLDFINLQKQSMLDDLEARREAANKQAGEQSRSESSKKDSGGGFMLPGLAGLALPALTALVASLTGLDEALRGFALPRIFKNLARVVTGIADGVRDALRFVGDLPRRLKTAFDAFADIFPKIKFDPGMLSMRLQNFILDIGVKIEQIGNAIGDFFKAAKEGAIARVARIADAIGDFFRPITQAFDNFKAGAIERAQGVFNSVSDTIKTIRDGFTNAFTRISNSIKSFFTFDGPPAFVTKIFDDVKSIFSSFKIEMPDWIKDFKIPGLDTIKAFFVGTDAGGGVLGFFSKLMDFAKPILAPLKMVARNILGPVSQLIMGIIDFFVGFYEGFVGKAEFDEETGEQLADSRGFLEKIKDGLVGGIKGLIKGITEAVDFLLVGIPAWIAGKLGFTEFSENLNKFWDEGGLLTRFVDPFIDFLLNIPAIISDLLPSFEDLKGMFSKFAEKLNPANWSIFGGSSDPAKEAKERLKEQETKRQQQEKELADLEAKRADLKSEMVFLATKGLGADGNRIKDLTPEEKKRFEELSRQSTDALDKVGKLRAELGKPESKMAETAELDPRVVSYRKLMEAQNEKEEAQANANKRGGGANLIDASNKTTNNNNNSTTIQTGALPPPRDMTDRALAIAS